MHIVGASCHLSKHNVSETGILEEILLENKWRNPSQCYSVWDTVLWEKVHFQEGLDAYLNTCLNDVTTQNGKITTARCYQETTEMTYDFKAKVFIDATGHATLGFMETNTGLYNTRIGVILPYVAFGLPTAILIACSYINGIPDALVEAAVIDGASYSSIFWRIILIISTPVIATIAVLNFLSNWNEFLLVFTLTSGQNMYADGR